METKFSKLLADLNKLHDTHGQFIIDEFPHSGQWLEDFINIVADYDQKEADAASEREEGDFQSEISMFRPLEVL